MEKIESKPVAVADESRKPSFPSGDDIPDSLLPGGQPDLSFSGHEPDHSPDHSLEVVRKILFGEQLRATEKKQVSLERDIRHSVDALNKETQQQLNLLRKEFQALEQKTTDWRQEMLQQIEQASRQLQQNNVSRQTMAGLLESMAGQLTGCDLPASKSGQ